MSHRRWTSRPMKMGVLAAAGAIALLAAPRVYACGGLFCNSPPPDPFAPLPVAQTGENVVFAVERDASGANTTVTVHIQVLYSGPADKFSWVVPVDGVPVLGTGTDRLFTALATVTQPRFQPSYVTDGLCINPPPSPGSADGGFFTGASGGAAGTGAGGTSGGSPVNVAFQGAVGPYDAAVIQSTDGMALREWLTTNGYFIGPDAEALIDAYVAEGKVFVALKLLNGKDVRAIQPIVLTFHGTEPCVPLRLTAIAALPDMQVRVWVLGPTRAVPLRFYELAIDPLRIDWPGFGANYQTLLGQAANEAGGNAFAAEYAGPASIATGAVWLAGRNEGSQLRAAMTPPVYVQTLITLGLANDPLTLPLLAEYIPMPAAVREMGVTDSQFYGNLSLYWQQYVFPPFDLAALTDDIEATILEPRRKAQLMIDAHPYLTRLNTFISPFEMTEDPFFTFNPDLPEVSTVHTATIRTMCGDRQYMQCNAPVRLELPDGRMAWIRGGSRATTCQFMPYVSLPTTLPASEVVWERNESGEGARRIDNTEMIQAALAQHNANFPVESGTFPMPPMSGAGGAGGGGVRIDGGHSGGCGCGVGGGSGVTAAAALAGMAALVLGRARARARRRK